MPTIYYQPKLFEDSTSNDPSTLIVGDPRIESATYIGGQVTKVVYAPEVVEVPKDLFLETIDKLECYRDYLQIRPGREYAIDVERTIDELRSCYVKDKDDQDSNI